MKQNQRLLYWKNWKKVDFAIFDPKKSRCLVGLGQISGKPVKVVKKLFYQLIPEMFMDKVKNFCDHSMILWEMAGDLLTDVLPQPPLPHLLGLRILPQKSKFKLNPLYPVSLLPRAREIAAKAMYRVSKNVFKSMNNLLTSLKHLSINFTITSIFNLI